MRNLKEFIARVIPIFKMRQTYALSALIIGLLMGCSKSPIDPTEPTTALASQDVGLETRKENIRRLSTLLRKLYQDPEIVAEVNAAIKSGYYQDERVALKDLLNYDTSPLYKTDNYKSQSKSARVKFQAGKFATAFKDLLSVSNGNARTSGDGDYFNNGTYNIYWPYSENFVSNNGQTPTVVDAVEESDYAVVQDPYGCVPARLDCEATVVVDDFYATNKVTHIIGDVPPQIASNSTLDGNLNKVWLGWVRCRKQYDKFISLTGNGGGSELKGMRINGYLKTEGQQITTYTDNLISVGEKGQVTRKQIREGQWVRVYGFFDTNWEQDDKEQALVIFEEDTQGTGKVEGSITTKSSALEIKPFSYSISVQTQDEIPVIFTIDRNFLFTNGRNNQQHGFQDGWPIYDGDGPISYTVPFEIIQQ